MNTSKYVLMAAIGWIAIATANVARADSLTLSPTGFGVGASAGNGPVNAITGQNFQNGVSAIAINTPNASLTANLNPNPPSPPPPTLGLKLTGGGPAFASGEVVAADGFTLLGAPATANFTLTGTFTPPPADPVDSEFGFQVRTYANPNVIAGSLDFVGGVLTPSGWEYSINGSPFAPWFNGTPVTLSVPVAAADMGIIADLTGDDTGTGIGAAPYVIDFLDPVTISFTPDPVGKWISRPAKSFSVRQQFQSLLRCSSSAQAYWAWRESPGAGSGSHSRHCFRFNNRKNHIFSAIRS